MKRLIVMVVVLLLTSSVMADVNKGKRYYMKNFKQKFKMDGLEFVQLHTQDEWTLLFENEGRGFIIEFSKKYPKYESYLSNPKTWKKLQHVRDFAIEYASDSGNIPSCGDDKGVEKPIDLETKDSSSANFF
ncbi:MAG: hypothetical protein PF439_04330 [Helicobacteraceae bacterium]|nr:hypothetical protein [Helicobacteraceae bacterium]